MRLKGKKIEGVFVETVVLPRPPIITEKDGVAVEEPNYLVFKLQAILAYDEFEKLVPEPIPREVVRPGNIRSRDFEDKDYKIALAEHNKKRFHWALLKSLSATEDLQWETVDANVPETWINHHKELQDAGISQYEYSKIVNAFHAANGLDESKMEAARKHFLQNQQAPAK